jgi:hypothetical protein
VDVTQRLRAGRSGKSAPAALARLWKTPRPGDPGGLFFLLFSFFFPWPIKAL